MLDDGCGCREERMVQGRGVNPSKDVWRRMTPKMTISCRLRQRCRGNIN